MDFINHEKGLEEVIFVSFSKDDYMLYKEMLDEIMGGHRENRNFFYILTFLFIYCSIK